MLLICALHPGKTGLVSEDAEKKVTLPDVLAASNVEARSLALA